MRDISNEMKTKPSSPDLKDDQRVKEALDREDLATWTEEIEAPDRIPSFKNLTPIELKEFIADKKIWNWYVDYLKFLEFEVINAFRDAKSDEERTIAQGQLKGLSKALEFPIEVIRVLKERQLDTEALIKEQENNNA